jgi:SAM-dependent methyltransferase
MLRQARRRCEPAATTDSSRYASRPIFAPIIRVNDALTLNGPQSLPLPIADRSFRSVVLRQVFEATAPADRLFLMQEARRVLSPEGRLGVVLPTAESADAVLHCARLLGLAPATEPRTLPTAQRPPGDETLVFRKPERAIVGAPLVSVAIPAYSPRFFEQALASALGQTYENIEFIVCDDSPGPEIEAISRRLARTRRVRYERNAVRLNGRGNYRRCFERAEGEFVKFLNDDDVLMPDCVERLVGAFRDAPEITLATSYRVRVDEAGNPLPDQPATRPIVERDMILHGAALAHVMLMAGLNIVGEPSTVLFRKADLLDVEPDYFCFDGAYGWGVIDMSMWSTLLLKGDAVYLREGLCHFRIHAGQHQRDPEIGKLSLQGIRNLQAAWLGLNLHTRFRRDMLLAKPYPADAQDWRTVPFTAVAQPPPVTRWWF